VYGRGDVFFRVRGWRGSLGMEEIVVGGGVIGGMSDFTSYRDFAG
jgi:hypothetical protein